MKVIISITTLVFLVSLASVAQVQTRDQARYVEIFSTGYDGSQMAFHIRPEGRYTEIKGSPYLEETWSDGRILLKGDSVGAGFRMRYNIYGNEMQFISKADTFAISNPFKLETLWLNDHRFEYLPFKLNQNENIAWFEILSVGKIRLLLRYSSRLESGLDPVTPYHCQNSADHFVTGKFYYYQTIDMELPVEMPASRSEFLSIPEFNKPEVKEFLRENKIRLHQEDDLLALFKWLNQTN